MASQDSPSRTYAHGTILKLHVITSSVDLETCRSAVRAKSSYNGVNSGHVQMSITGSANSESAIDLETLQFANMRITTPPLTPPIQGISQSLALGLENVLQAVITEAPDDLTFGVQNLPSSDKSVMMKVLMDGHSSPSILKLFDARFCPKICDKDSISHGSSEDISKPDGFVSNGESVENASFSCHTLSTLQSRCHDNYTLELAAYTALSTLQGVFVPKLLATVLFQPYPNADPDSRHHSTIHGLLISCVSGFSLQDLHQHMPRNLWRRAYNEIRDTVDSCGRFGVLIQDVRPQSYVVQCSTVTEESKRFTFRHVIVDLSMARMRYCHESDENWANEMSDTVDEVLERATLMLDGEMEDPIDDQNFEHDFELPHTEQDEILGEELTGFAHPEGETLVGIDGTEGMEAGYQSGRIRLLKCYPRAFLVDASEDLDSDGEEMADEEVTEEEAMIHFADWYNLASRVFIS